MSNKNSGQRLTYSVNEASAATSLGRTSIYGLINSGALKAVRVGGRTVIPACSLNQLVGEEAITDPKK